VRTRFPSSPLATRTSDDRLGHVITIVSAPSNLGLRPPEPGSVPGASKAPEALREAGLFSRLAASGATEGGVILPGRYVDDDLTRATGHVRNEVQLIEHTRRLARRIASVIAGGSAPLVIGGDCSLLIASGLALASERSAGLVHIDGHTDFRHPGNSDDCASVAGEDLAAAVGLHWPAIADIDGCGPYFLPADTVHIGCRENDHEVDEARAVLGLVLSARESIEIGMDACAKAARSTAGTLGYWLHVDVDVLDPAFMPAVDSPDPGGLNPDQLVKLLTALAPWAIGAEVTVFDPDLDPDGRCADLLSEIIATGMASLGSECRSTRLK
jgi:arginase